MKLLHGCALGERSSGGIWKFRTSSFKCYVDHSHTMYSSGNIDVRNWVHLFGSRCIFIVKPTRCTIFSNLFYSTLFCKYEKLVHLVGFSVEIYRVMSAILGVNILLSARAPNGTNTWPEVASELFPKNASRTKPIYCRTRCSCFRAMLPHVYAAPRVWWTSNFAGFPLPQQNAFREVLNLLPVLGTLDARYWKKCLL